jgi:hypothetical protein
MTPANALRPIAAAFAVVLTAASLPSAQAPTPAAARGAVSGVVTDAVTGRPIAGALLSLRRVGAPASGTVSQVTDARGRFVFDELAGRTQYLLIAGKPGYVDGYYSQPQGHTPGQVRFALADGQWLDGVHITLSKLGAIGGVVTDEFGEPVVGAFVLALAEINAGGRRELAAGPAAKTDDRGEYRLTGLLPARYLVMLHGVQHSVPA